MYYSIRNGSQNENPHVFKTKTASMQKQSMFNSLQQYFMMPTWFVLMQRKKERRGGGEREEQK
jgi:hypothetical protein